MWFKNLQIYRLSTPCPMTQEALDLALAKAAFMPCTPSSRESRGFIAPRGDDRYVYTVAGVWLIALMRETKLLPNAVINHYANERAAEIEAKEGRRPNRREMKELREHTEEALLLRAFCMRQTIFAWIDPKNGWLGIDASSLSKADEMLEALNKAVDGLPLGRVKTALSPTAAMTKWLAGDEIPFGLTIDRDCELKSSLEEKSAVRYIRHSLESDEVRNHLIAGKLPTRLALTWNDRLSFVLTDKLEIKRLVVQDILKEEAERNAENADELFDADLALMSGEFSCFLPDLLAALGGEMTDEL